MFKNGFQLTASPSRLWRRIHLRRGQRLTNRFRAEFSKDRLQGADALGELIAVVIGDPPARG
jgi:hypothetical protein